MIQFFKKTIYFITILSISLFNVSNLNAQEYTVSGQGTTNPLDVQTRGLNELIEKVDEEIKDVTNCGGSQQFFTGSGCEYLNESEPQTNSAAKSPMISCPAANELAKWNGTNWYCESITVPNDCAGNAQLSECSTSSLSLQNGQTQTGVTCEGTYGQCSADVTCNSGSYSISNEYCPPIPVNCYDSVGGAGCTTMRSLSHGQAGNWSCDTGYTGDCSAVCNAGNFQAASNQCSGAGTWTPGAWGTCSNTCGTGTQTRTYTCVGGVCTTPQPADDSQSCTNYSTCNFTWQSGSWGTCSVTCGGGTQTRTVVCKRSDGTTVSDSNCSGTKPASSQTCNTTACATYSWQTGSWGTCSVTCGGGTQTRTVVCKRNDGVTVADGNCSGAKPANSQTCNATACMANCPSQTKSFGTKHKCVFSVPAINHGNSKTVYEVGSCNWGADPCDCTGTFTCNDGTLSSTWTFKLNPTSGPWTAGSWSGWSTCSATCGGGTQTRTRSVTCSYDSCTGTKPSSSESQTCNTQACATSGPWTTSSWSGWSTCSKACGTGTQSRTRSVTCSYDSCTGTKPSSSESQNCNTQACYTYSWQSGSWSTCSKTCGGGTKTRTVTCKRNDGTTVSSTYCSGTKPATSETCNTQSCVSYSWYTGSYGACSTTCGTGSKTRTVYCKKSDGSAVYDSYCSGTKPTTWIMCTDNSNCADCTNKTRTLGPMAGSGSCTVSFGTGDIGDTSYKKCTTPSVGASFCAKAKCTSSGWQNDSSFGIGGMSWGSGCP